jgi:2-keto-4-pentenoate hydratase
MTLHQIAPLLSILLLSPLWSQSPSCTQDQWADDFIYAWQDRGLIEDANCYRDVITNMDQARELRDEVWARLDQSLPRVGYKVVGLDPINAALEGVDRPMVGAMYEGMFMLSGDPFSISSAEIIITEPDILISIKDAAVMEATTLEELLPHLGRIYAFIETLSPTFVNAPANAYLMQAANIMARWGVIGESVEVVNSEAFLRSLETMQVTFEDGDGNVLASEPGAYLGVNPLNGVLVVIEELKRLGLTLQPGDLISSGSYMPPVRVSLPIKYTTRYKGIGGQDISVMTTFIP